MDKMIVSLGSVESGNLVKQISFLSYISFYLLISTEAGGSIIILYISTVDVISVLGGVEGSDIVIKSSTTQPQKKTTKLLTDLCTKNVDQKVI